MNTARASVFTSPSRCAKRARPTLEYVPVPGGGSCFRITLTPAGALLAARSRRSDGPHVTCPFTHASELAYIHVLTCSSDPNAKCMSKQYALVIDDERDIRELLTLP